MATDFYPLVIDGQTRPAASGEVFSTRDPATREVIGTAARGAGADIDAAVAAAGRSFRESWRPLQPADRARLLRRLGDLVARDADELSRLESLDTGKPLSQARTDVTVAGRYFEFYAGIADMIAGETIPISREVFAYTTREPFGVTGHIVPWNYPLQIAARTIAPALAAGNCCVLKPAEETPVTAVRLGQLASPSSCGR